MELNHEPGNDLNEELNNSPEEKEDDEELMEDIRIYSASGTEYEI